MRRRFFLISLLLLLPAFARADDVSVSAKLSDSQTDVGEAVDYQIEVSGGDARVPENIYVDGLSITYTGQSTQTQVSFGSAFGSGAHSQTTNTYTYSVVPQRPGTFTIPAQSITVNDNPMSTHPVNLVVTNGGNASSNGGATAGGASGGGDNPDNNSPLYFVQLLLPKTTAYIGETVPVEVKIYLDARIAQQLSGPPDISVESCTLQQLNKPEQSQVDRDGRTYVIVTYKTAVTPVKAGALKIGPVSQDCVVRMPQRRPRRTGGPFDNPMFDDPFFDDAFRMMGPPQQVTAKSDAEELDVKPLPAAGQPDSFSGAVGQYTLNTTAKPTMVEAGDPVTITAKIQGEGNFDRVTAPELVDPAGWRAYPPSAKFAPDDDIGISGVKTFDMAIVPEQNQTQTPALEWSYFDPDSGHYVTLTGPSVPIKIEGQVAAVPTPSLPQPTPAPANAAPTPAAPDIVYIDVNSTGWGRTFQPLYETRGFWMAQAVPLLALLAFIGIRVRKIRADDVSARQRDEWRREKEQALAAARRRGVTDTGLYEETARALRLEAAIHLGRAPETLDPTEVLAARQLDAGTARSIQQLFDHQAEALYAGSSAGSRPASAETQAEALDLVKKYETAKPVS